MKATRKSATWQPGLILLAGLLLLAPAGRLCAQPVPQQTAAQQASRAAAADEHMDAPESNSEIEQYRHSAAVQAIARHTHLSIETAAQIFEDFNSAVLLLAIFWFLWKALPKMFRQRSETLARELVDARYATEDANRKLAEVEARLSRLDSEIEEIRLQVEKDAAEDEKRIRATLETERARMIASAEQEIAAAQAGAQRELKKFAADLAIDQAMHRIRLTAETDRALVREFGAKLGNGGKA